jgi:hypothetical protein
MIRSWPNSVQLKIYPVFRVHDVLVWIRIRGSMPMTNGSGSESCYFRHWPSRRQQKTIFYIKVCLLITFTFFKSQNSRDQGFTLKACKGHLDVGRNSLLVLGKYLLFIFFILKTIVVYLSCLSKLDEAKSQQLFNDGPCMNRVEMTPIVTEHNCALLRIGSGRIQDVPVLAFHFRSVSIWNRSLFHLHFYMSCSLSIFFNPCLWKQGWYWRLKPFTVTFKQIWKISALALCWSRVGCGNLNPRSG